jgi:enoyl-CoA hydratase
LTRLGGPGAREGHHPQRPHGQSRRSATHRLADEVVPLAELNERAMAIAATYARGALVAQGLAKHAINAGLDGSLADGLALEQQLFAKVFATEDARIGIESFKQHGPGKATFVGK